MKKIARILPLVGILCSSLNAYEYVYPVGTFIDYEGETCVLSLYQKTPDHTELWQSNMGTQEPFITHEVNRALLSTFTPVGVAMLPDNAGFSFFDNGRLRIKNFLKRSPKAIDIYEPIYDIGPLQWVSIDTCIFHAKERDHFSLYELNASDGSVTKIMTKEASDCFYPSQQGNSLFYIQRTYTTEETEKEDSLKEAVYSLWRSSVLLPEPTTRYNKECCLICHDKPLACLTMFDEHHGLIIEHPANVDTHKETVFACACYQVICADSLESASLVKLFSFTLPLSLILLSSKARLCESLYPLLPRKIGDSIYFVSCVEGSEETRPFCYTDTEGVQPISFHLVPFGDIFTPYLLEKPQPSLLPQLLIYGGSLQRELLRDDQEPAETLIIVTK